MPTKIKDPYADKVKCANPNCTNFVTYTRVNNRKTKKFCKISCGYHYHRKKAYEKKRKNIQESEMQKVS